MVRFFLSKNRGGLDGTGVKGAGLNLPKASLSVSETAVLGLFGRTMHFIQSKTAPSDSRHGLHFLIFFYLLLLFINKTQFFR